MSPDREERGLKHAQWRIYQVSGRGKGWTYRKEHFCYRVGVGGVAWEYYMELGVAQNQRERVGIGGGN